MFIGNVNPLAVIVVAILSMIIATIWYSPNVLGGIWASALHLSPDSLKPSPIQYIGELIVSIIKAWGVAVFINWLGLDSVAGGLQLGFLVWLGFIASSHFSGVIWAKKPLKAYFIDTGYELVNFIFMGAVLALWK